MREKWLFGIQRSKYGTAMLRGLTGAQRNPLALPGILLLWSTGLCWPVKIFSNLAKASVSQRHSIADMLSDTAALLCEAALL